MAAPIRVFISHAHPDDDQALAFRRLLRRSERPFVCSLVLAGRTRLVRSSRVLAQEFLAPRIRWSHALVVLLSDDAIASEWVRWEVTYATQRGKPVVVLPIPGLEAGTFPAFLAGRTVVSWDGNAVWEAVTTLRSPADEETVD